MGRGGGREESELLARALAATPGIHRTGKLQSHQPGASGSLSLTWIKVAYCPPRLPNSLPPTFSWFTKKDEKLEGVGRRNKEGQQNCVEPRRGKAGDQSKGDVG